MLSRSVRQSKHILDYNKNLSKIPNKDYALATVNINKNVSEMSTDDIKQSGARTPINGNMSQPVSGLAAHSLGPSTASSF